MNRTYTIRELTKEFNVTARTLRHYEDEGLIAPARRGQARIYSQRDHARVTLILRGRRVGFSLAEIREILDLYDRGDGGTKQNIHARAKFAERIEALDRQKKDIEESLAELHRAVALMDQHLGKTARPMAAE
jgi:DNA-binding transcriptional MerR regulator